MPEHSPSKGCHEMKRAMVPVTVFLISLALGGCQVRRNLSPPEGHVGMDMMFPKGASRYDMQDDQRFLMPEFAAAPVMPVYPPSLLNRGAGRTRVCIEVVVDEAGAVTDARALLDTPGCPGASEHPDQVFYDAAFAAVRQWQFFAAAVCVFPSGVEPDDECKGEGVDVKAVAVKLAFVFSFEVGADGAAVTVHRR